jgi:MFS family permease
LLPLFLQNLRGLGAAETGLILISQVLPMMIAMPVIGKLVDKVGPRPIILIGLPFLALATWQMGALDLNTTDMTLRLWLAARGCAMGFVMMPSMTAGLNAIPLDKMSRGSAISNVMRQVFGAFGTAIVVTILQQRQAFHTAMLSQMVTPQNLALQKVLSATQTWALGQGMSSAQSQMMGVMMVARQVGITAAVMAYDDVFRITAAVTLLAVLPALFLNARKIPRGGGPGAASVIID